MPTLYEKRGRRYQFWGSAEQWNSCDMFGGTCDERDVIYVKAS